MKVILKQDIDSLGMEGGIVDVAKGYARNYLIPQGLALEASSQNIKFMETQRKKIEIRRLKAKEDAEKIKQRLADLTVTISQKVGEEEKLYGSVTTMDIAEALEKKDVVVDRKKLQLDKPIKTLGEFQVPIKLHPEVTCAITVVVIPEESA
ncbi:MAG: 50S ribosomal protein L9 [Deltaproteobacteria bacterium]|nr:50S ribosomal protein L9 [Deltaproteobacteria bacterium]